MLSRITRRRLLQTACALPLMASMRPSQAADFPDRPITFVVPFVAGGVADIQARVVAPPMSNALGASLIIDNRGGASGSIGAQLVTRAKSDGYTILLSTISILATNPHLYSNLSFDALTDLEPISRLSTVDNLFVVSPSLPVHNIQELIAYSKTKDGGVTFGSAGAGGSLHLTGELLRSMTDLRYTHIPYKGSAPAEINLIGGQIDLIVTSVAAALPNIKAGKMRAIAATRAKRSVMLPDVPTVAESGVPGFEVDSWIAVHGPKGMAPAEIKLLDAAVRQATEDPIVIERFRQLGLEPFYASSEELARYQLAESERWGALIKKLNIKLDS
ncbi:tripartite tricarboxylate transporter substrate binding protein [Bordetella sp. BOR01]|uniref:Bug family tripartite tricarboxylate transporter substrate binding protein n=1 Tax=Bordetella sp. BOR01 TaxID=2854779 RepID=UPI002103B47D|nr:tripartite tricarboxylate transporter substrate binding protein [Bordetella sp. BOR01]